MSSGEVCSWCGTILATRPVWTEIRRTDSAGRPIRKRVHMKPLQLVVALRWEGAPSERSRWRNAGDNSDLPIFRLCGPCLEGKNVGEFLAVWLDRVLDRLHVGGRVERLPDPPPRD